MARAPKKQPSFATRRLRLRPFRAGDLDAMHALYSDAENLRYWSTLAYRPRHYVFGRSRRARAAS